MARNDAADRLGGVQENSLGLVKAFDWNSRVLNYLFPLYYAF